MKEKIIAFLQDEKVKEFNKKIFNKKNLKKVIALIVILALLKITYLFMFEVKGVVKKVEGSKITVVNFLTTQTVDVGDFENILGNIQAGDRILIKKNLSGQVMSVKDYSYNIKDERAYDRHNFKGFHGRNFKRR
ncbi:hypothetical protein SAMN05443428_11189 [Caloramator quimbayensis]|uniref:Uncharacterized protein n=1 Tax=Caloramator quimbayensis TaxID=1147123 RepID=A0A1T4XQ17_9CLOT|nr:hypothetical protein [Caloramator quimbayensis]SKA91627.1 hypothetical protein SAMN05443428_11189 [Caloramator quimbayensis]